MMDFGSTGLFERFERHFGKGVTVCLEALIALTITSVCIGAIWQFLAPIAHWLGQMSAGMKAAGISTSDLVDFALVLTAIAGAFFSALWLIIDRAKAERELALQHDLIEQFRYRMLWLEQKVAAGRADNDDEPAAD